MVQPQTIVTVADNSGAKVARVFKVLGGSKRRYAEIGDVVVVSIQTAEPRKAVKKKDIYKAVVVRQKSPTGAALTEAFIINAIKGKLANFKVPKWVYLVDQLPRNAMGKVQKNILRQQYSRNSTL